ncbi:hypothetical protein LAUMK40_04660 [Mycobacterium kansasii]|nr:hypothetical protein LAUMK40_04660 [Mycobacterium kansasii]
MPGSTPGGGTCGTGAVSGAGAGAGTPSAGEPGLVGSATNWFTEAATFLDSGGAAGLWTNACAAAISSCVACPGLLAACWIIGLNWVNAGRPGSCWLGLGCGAAGSAAAAGQSPNAAAEVTTAAAKPLDRLHVLATVVSPVLGRWSAG